MQIDWLSINYNGILCKSILFTAKETSKRSKYFNKITEYLAGSEIFCTVASEPFSSILEKDLVQIKISNRFLYQKGLVSSIKMFLSEHDLKFKGFSRIDIAYDFNYFFDALPPQNFIYNFLSEEYQRAGRGTWHSSGKHQESLVYEYLGFGSRYSDIRAYLYNKSTEMREVVNKPYIKEQWLKNGLDCSQDVWRLEFSLKGDVFKIIDTRTGEEIKHELDIIENYDFIYNFFTALIEKYWDFSYRNSINRKSRANKIKLFDFKPSYYQHLNYSNEKDSNRSDKIYINVDFSYFLTWGYQNPRP